MAESVIFDCDGVLVDSEPAANAVLADLITEIGIPTTPEQSLATYMGRSWASCVEIVERELGRAAPDDFGERYRAGVTAAWRRELRPVPGVVEALDAIDLPNCVAVSYTHLTLPTTPYV